MENNRTTQENFLTIRQVTDRIALSKSAIYRRMDPKDKLYDPTFPQPIKLGQTTARWLESDVDAWIDSLIQNQRNNAA
ncbi:MAG: AlpA family phage regulatory protein [Hydrogenovibrio sp.]|uniref:helix-turn-helix transcriptional regulator n=1 Tax=Hydrogenovibrio sp. TaxID=2065821 RepID=UPI00286FFEB1|nr:AlpA family phage regulatory protein [Hydrogenovibrio sp.]MDR9500108.1 AlpA family phage regulatory protein [Hydrogenovibrio sp.]